MKLQIKVDGYELVNTEMARPEADKSSLTRNLAFWLVRSTRYCDTVKFLRNPRSMFVSFETGLEK